MLMTERNAREHWCPEARIPVTVPHWQDGQESSSVSVSNRVPGGSGLAFPAESGCLGPRCSSWRWYEVATISQADGGERRGYCGRAGAIAKP